MAPNQNHPADVCQSAGRGVSAPSDAGKFGRYGALAGDRQLSGTGPLSHAGRRSASCRSESFPSNRKTGRNGRCRPPPSQRGKRWAVSSVAPSVRRRAFGGVSYPGRPIGLSGPGPQRSNAAGAGNACRCFPGHVGQCDRPLSQPARRLHTACQRAGHAGLCPPFVPVPRTSPPHFWNATTGPAACCAASILL